MCRCWSSSICSLLLWTCLTACSGSVSDNGIAKAGSPAVDGGGGDSGTAYRGDAGEQVEDAGSADAAQGGAGGNAGSAGSSGARAPIGVEPAQCLPDPSDFTPCGGDVTGKWRIASVCFNEGLEGLREELECPELTQEFSSDYRMLVEFQNGGRYSAGLDAEAVQKVTLPFSCLPEGVDCRALLGADDTDDSDGQTLLITMTDEGCFIEAREHSAINETGTWSVSGSELTMTNATGPATSEYCVTGNTLISKNVNEVTGAVSWGVFERL